MLNLIIAAIVFFVAAWLLNQYLDEQSIPNSITRAVMVLMLASLTSWGVWWAVDWAQTKVAEPQVAVQSSGGVSQILKAANQTQP